MNKVDYKEIGKRISARRRELGMKQWQAEQKAGLSDKYLSNIERATSVLSVDVLVRLCAVLETTPNAILLGTSYDDENDYQRSASERIRQMSSKQARLALSLMDWLLSQKLE